MNEIKVREILINPPIKRVECSNCGGRGFFPTGAISTKTCSTCKGTEKETVVDHDKWVSAILELHRASFSVERIEKCIGKFFPCIKNQDDEAFDAPTFLGKAISDNINELLGGGDNFEEFHKPEGGNPMQPLNKSGGDGE